MNRLLLGRAGEEAALAEYERDGYAVVARNWRCHIGEIDLIVARAGTLVVCEVKSRSNPAFGGGWEAVTPAKQQRLRRLAQLFLLESRIAPCNVRFDVASVEASPSGDRVREVVIFEDAF